MSVELSRLPSFWWRWGKSEHHRAGCFLTESQGNLRKRATEINRWSFSSARVETRGKSTRTHLVTSGCCKLHLVQEPRQSFCYPHYPETKGGFRETGNQPHLKFALVLASKKREKLGLLARLGTNRKRAVWQHTCQDRWQFEKQNSAYRLAKQSPRKWKEHLFLSGVLQVYK